MRKWTGKEHWGRITSSETEQKRIPFCGSLLASARAGCSRMRASTSLSHNESWQRTWQRSKAPEWCLGWLDAGARGFTRQLSAGRSTQIQKGAMQQQFQNSSQFQDLTCLPFSASSPGSLTLCFSTATCRHTFSHAERHTGVPCVHIREGCVTSWCDKPPIKIKHIPCSLPRPSPLQRTRRRERSTRRTFWWTRNATNARA